MEQRTPAPGELSFEVLAEIALGETAVVEMCRVRSGRLAGEIVAVKRLHPHIAEDPQFFAMFRDEVWMAAALKHKNVVEVVGWGQDAEGPYLAVELVRGVSLARLMKTVFETGEMFSERMVVYLAACMCDGLAAAHALKGQGGEPLGLVHRDLTPGNVLLGFGGEVKVTDFGLAKAKQRLTRTLTGLLKGQPQYMSPEQVRGEALDGRSDVFALGVVLFELFAGRRPWNVTSDIEAMRATAEEAPLDLGELRPRLDRALIELVHRCLEKPREARFQTAGELRDRLAEWLAAHGYRDNAVALARFVRRNAMRQMRWYERAAAGEFAAAATAARSHRIGVLGPATARALAGSDRPDQSEPGAPMPRPGPEDDDLEDPATVDWGDEGPTLIQRSERVPAALRAPLPAAGRRPSQPAAGPVAGEPAGDSTTRRHAKSSNPPATASHPGAARSEGDPRGGEASELTTVPGNQRTAARADGPRRPMPTSVTAIQGGAPVAPRAPHAAEEPFEPDATIPIQAAGDRVRRVIAGADLGVVAPPDPDAPPPPVPSRSAMQAVPVSSPPGALAQSSGPPRAPLPSGERAVGAESGAAHAGLALGAPPAEGALHPQHALPAGAAPPAAEAGGVGPAQLLAALERSSDVRAEAQRLAAEAMAASQAAQRAADVAEAAARAAALAAEAALLAAAGDHDEAVQRLREAQLVDETLKSGQIPRRMPIQPDLDLLMPSSISMAQRRAARAARGFMSREGVTFAVIGAAALLLVGLFLALIR